jgi:hypothetical protein
MRITLEKVTNIVVIAGCLFVVGNLLYRNHNSKQQLELYPAGSRIQDVPSLGLKSSERTLILATSSSCHFCVASLPFYRRLAAAAKGGGTRMVAVTHEPPPVNRAFLEGNGVPVDAAVPVAESGVLVQVTPAIILVRQDGTVIESWIGEVSSKKEAQVLRLAAGR